MIRIFKGTLLLCLLISSAVNAEYLKVIPSDYEIVEYKARSHEEGSTESLICQRAHLIDQLPNVIQVTIDENCTMRLAIKKGTKLSGKAVNVMTASPYSDMRVVKFVLE